MSSPESESSPEGTPTGPSPKRRKYSPLTPQPSSQLGVASTSKQIPTVSHEFIQGKWEEIEGNEPGSETDSSSEEEFEYPKDVTDYYAGSIANQLVQAGINDDDRLMIFLMGEYIFVKKLGEGRYAKIFKCVTFGTMKAPLKQEVAIKVVKPILESQHRGADREWEIIETLMERPHINILTYIDLFKNDDATTDYIVSELAPLGDLYQVLCKQNDQRVEIWDSIKPQYCRNIIRGIARGVQHLFSLGISHGDVKAENVLIFWNNQPAQPDEDHPLNQNLKYMRMVPKLMDFNNSQQCEPGGPIMCEQPKCAAYTAAPESWFTNTPYDGKKADVYSVGAILLNMLLGCHAFLPPPNCPPALKTREIINMKKSLNFVKQLVRPFDFRLKQLLLKTLEPLPQNRITIEEFLSDDWFTQRMESQEREERWESTLWRGLPQKRSAWPGGFKSY